MLKTKTLFSTQPTQDDDDYVTGFEYLLEDNDRYHLFVKESEHFDNPEEDYCLYSQIFENEEYETPDEENSILHHISFKEIPFKYKVIDNLKTYSFYNDTYLNHFKTAIMPRLDEDLSIKQLVFFDETFDTPEEILTNIDSCVEENESYSIKDASDFVDQSFQTEDKSFRYRDNHSLKTFFNFNRQLNNSFTAIQERLEENCFQAFETEFSEKFKASQEADTINSRVVSEEKYVTKLIEDTAVSRVSLEEENYKFFYDSLSTFYNFNSKQLNTSRTAIQPRVTESCFIRLYRIEGESQVVLREEAI